MRRPHFFVGLFVAVLLCAPPSAEGAADDDARAALALAFSPGGKTPPPSAKPGPCSPLCTCGCVYGGECTCNNPPSVEGGTLRSYVRPPSPPRGVPRGFVPASPRGGLFRGGLRGRVFGSGGCSG